MSTPDLSLLKSTDLRAMLAEVNAELVKREAQDRTTAKDQILAIAQSVGMSVMDLIGKEKKVAKVAARYRNPADASEVWTGRGRKPRWVEAALKDGASLESFAIAPATA